jgi:hypothetical protein
LQKKGRLLKGGFFIANSLAGRAKYSFNEILLYLMILSCLFFLRGVALMQRRQKGACSPF